MPNTAGTFRLFQIAGITVFLHWSWFLVAVYEVQQKGRYSSLSWGILEYVTIFAIVTLHEFGHALACRQVGGRAERIVLWPLGGVAYVDPPARPGANLWSISAGPLVNLALMPVLGLAYLALRRGSGSSSSDLSTFVASLNLINIALFVFNVLPIYPLDGGKILRSLLWYIVGRARSLMASVIVGFIGVAGLGLFAFSIQSGWLGVVTVFAAMQCFNGYKLAQALKRLEDTPRREGVACPSCKASPPLGVFWSCGLCKTAFDTFAENAKCPKCYTTFPKTTCTECGIQSPFSNWFAPAAADQTRETPGLKGNSPLVSPSVVPVVLGIVSGLGALVLLVIAFVFFKVSSDVAALKPQYNAEIDSLWQSDGIPVPGQQTLTLQRTELYNAYVERNASDKTNNNVIHILIANAETGLRVPLTPFLARTPLQRNNRTLAPTVSFRVPETGRYTVQAASETAETFFPRIKIGPSIALASGSGETAVRYIGIGVSLFAIVLIALAVLLFIIYFRRQQEFQKQMRQAAGSSL
jgi:Zn-dependent protease